MKKVIFLVILLLVLFSAAIYGEKVTELPELMKPTSMVVDDTRLYVVEGASIYIYSLKDFKVIKKFGRQGQGPQEFYTLPQLPLYIDVTGDRLTAFSVLRVSYFTTKGEFINEIRASTLALGLLPFGDQFLGVTITQEEGVRYKIINIYDSKLKKLKEIYKIKDNFQRPGQGIKVLDKAFSYQGYENKIVLPGEDDATVDIFDSDMKKLCSIAIDQKRIKIGQDFKDAIIEHFKTTPGLKEQYEIIKPVILPDYFPRVAAFFVVDGMIYVLTWKKENNRSEFFTYDMNGKLKKRLMVPIQYETKISPYPIQIYKGKLYQIVENADEEVWEFHMSEIK